MYVCACVYIYIKSMRVFSSPELSRERQVVQDILRKCLNRVYWVQSVQMCVVCIYARTIEHDIV